MEENKKLQKNKGITLVALVVTIVVLLILAGITLSMVVGENGIITKAKEARDKMAEAQHNDQLALNEMEGWLNKLLGDNSNSTEEPPIEPDKPGEPEQDKIVDGVKIPEGYYYVGGTKDSGLVISDEPNDENRYKDAIDVGKDLIGNQWVWVPVENPSELYIIATKPIAITGGSTKVISGVTTSKYTASIILSEKTRVLPNDTKSYREPDIVVGSDGIKYDTVKANYNTAGFSSSQNMAETLVLEYDLMTKSLEKYKGFYIGRYELTANGEKAGTSLTNTNWYKLYAKCKELAPSGNDKVMTRMIWGLQWDATCNWLSSKYNITDSSAWGNYSNNKAEGKGIKQDTGFSESWKANNIYDFAGNCDEWSQEAYSTNSRADRGGDFDGSGLNSPASYRDHSILDGTVSSHTSSRATLFMM